MPTFEERYQAGQHEAVWQELQVLGATVRDPAIYPDAVAVAHKTMRRVRANCVTLIDRLSHLGYRFGKDGEWDGETLTRERSLFREGSGLDQPRLSPPLPDIAAQLDAAEARYGVLPIALRAFYEVVGAVNLCGYFPLTPGDWERCDRAALPDLSEYEQPVPETLDPLQVFPFDAESLRDREEDAPDFFTLYITPDYLAKMGYSAVGSLETTLPCETMDGFVWLEEPYSDPDLLFVNLLRQAFRYGGFNHLSSEAGSDNGRETAAFLRALKTPGGQSYLDYLTRDLLAF